MKLHRFYIPANEQKLEHKIWVTNEAILKQWNSVLRFKSGQQVVLFDGMSVEKLYKISELTRREARLELVTDLVRKTPRNEIYLFWSLLKKDKNDWVLQKCTELGVSHFVPIIAARSEKTGFDEERAKKIIIEAVEQCGRGDIPTIREPMNTATAINDYKDKTKLYICEQGEESTQQTEKNCGVLIGPEGGWADEEKDLFKKYKLAHLNLHDFTLRAETAAITAVSKLN